MKGLLIKDLRLMKGQKHFLILFLMMVLVFWTTGMDTSFFMGYIPFLMLTFTMSTITYDEFDNGMAFLMTLPISRKEYVLEKYFLGTSAASGGLILAFLIFLFSEEKSDMLTSFSSAALLLLCFFACIAVFLCLMIPVQLRFGSEKGRIVLFSVFFGILGIGYFFSKYVDVNHLSFSGLSKTFIIFSLLIFLIILFLLSIKISIKILKKKEW